MFEATLTGDWKKAKRTIQLLPTFTKVLNERLLTAVSERFYQALIAHLREQDLALEPLSKWYSLWKTKRGLDGRILIATGQMVGEIRIHENGNEKFVGIKGGKRHQSGIDIALLALVHEYGSVARGIPARPVYRLTVAELRRELETIVQAVIDETAVEVFG